MHKSVFGKISLILIAAFVLRLLFLGFDGFHNDVQTFEAWTLTLRDQPFSSFYARAGFADYPPGYLYFLAAIARIYTLIGTGDSSYQLLHLLVKLPGILFDLVNAALVYMLVRRFVNEKRALLATSIVAFNPACIFISAYWGQVDSVAATFVLLALLALDRGLRCTWPPMLVGIVMWTSLALSILIKPTALLLVPLLFVWAPAVWRAKGRDGLTLRIVATFVGIAAALVLTYVLSLPFAPRHSPLSVVTWLIDRYRFGSNVYPYNSINAFNMYAIAQSFWEPDSVRHFLTFGLKQSTWGALLVIAATLMFTARFLVLATPLAALEAATLTLFAFFMLATRMHERYVFDAVLLMMVLGGIARRYLAAVFVMTITLFCNLWYSLQYLTVMTVSTPGADPRNLMPWVSRPCALLNVLLLTFYGLNFLGVFDNPNAEKQSEEPNIFERFVTRGSLELGAWYDRWIRYPNLNEGIACFTRLDVYLSIGFSVLSFLICIVGYAHPSERIFDEIYYARSGEEYLKHVEQFEWTHPPLTKLIITVSMLLFGGLHGGNTSYGWRFLNVVIGALMVGLLYAFAKRISGSTFFASIAAGCLLFDGFHFAQSRIATPEITVAFFCLLTLYTFYRFWMASDAAPETREPLSNRLLATYGLAGIVALSVGWLLSLHAGTKPDSIIAPWLPALVLMFFCCSGAYALVRLATSRRSKEANWWLFALTVSAGCVGACKWNGLFDFFVIWASALALLSSRWVPQLRFLGNIRALPLDLLMSSMLFVGGIIYVLTYIPYFSLGHSFFDLLGLQHMMYAYHSDLRATHPYSSAWWQWPILQRPISYYYHDFRTGVMATRENACCVAEILALPNPLVWWLGLLSVPAVAVMGWLEKRRGYLLLVLAYFLQWLPWIASPRIAFEYHFFPNLAIICCCDALLLQRLWVSAGPSASLRSWQRITCIVVMVSILIAFVYWYPIVAGIGMTYSQWYHRVLTWLPFVHWI